MNVTQQHKVWQNLHIACTRRESRATKATTNDCIAAKKGFRRGATNVSLALRMMHTKKEREREKRQGKTTKKFWANKNTINSLTRTEDGRMGQRTGLRDGRKEEKHAKQNDTTCEEHATTSNNVKKRATNALHNICVCVCVCMCVRALLREDIAGDVNVLPRHAEGTAPVPLHNPSNTVKTKRREEGGGRGSSF